MIKIKDYDKNKGKLSFSTDMSVSMANAIRRSVLEIPVMAIDDIEISKNDSALYDEIIAHRLGLIPIKTDKLIKETKFKLQVVGPRTVYATDLKPSVETDLKLPIVILDNEQELEVVANARLGRGIDHIKYSPGLVFFRHNLDEVLEYVTINDEGKVSFDEDDLKNNNVSDEIINKVKKLSNVNELLFNIESWGQIEPREIFLKSVDALNKNLDELHKAVK